MLRQVKGRGNGLICSPNLMIGAVSASQGWGFGGLQIAFSSEVGIGSREENASNKKRSI
jgi:hypothetical protein